MIHMGINNFSSCILGVSVIKGDFQLIFVDWPDLTNVL